MRKKLLIALAVVAGLILCLVIFVALQPSHFRVTRSATMEAPPEEVFAQVNDFHNWDAWSPWAELDPNADNSFSGPPEGEGSIFRWSGNDDVGEGSMTIVESQPPNLVRIKLEFVRPFEDSSDVEFTFEPEGEATQVTWDMSGESNFIGKAMCLVMDMDEMVGGDFEKGLSSMKKVVEADDTPQ